MSEKPTDLAELGAADFYPKALWLAKVWKQPNFSPKTYRQWTFRAANFFPQRLHSGQILEAPISFPQA